MYYIEKKLNKIENVLSAMASIPIIGMAAGSLKVLLGSGQLATASFVFIVAKVARRGKRKEWVTYSSLHIKHGLGNIAAGVIEAIPAVGTATYLLRKNMEKGAIEEYLREAVLNPQFYVFQPPKEEVDALECKLYIKNSFTRFESLQLDLQEKGAVCDQLGKRFLGEKALYRKSEFIQGGKLMAYPQLLEKGGETVFKLYRLPKIES